MFILVAAILAATSLAAQVPFQADPAFQTNMSEQYVSSIHLDASGGIVISGRFRFPSVENEKFTARLTGTGIRDQDFNATTLGGGAIKSWQNGKMYVANNQTVRRLLPNGFQDGSFIEMNFGPYFSSLQGGDFHVFPDGRVLMSGSHVLSDSIRGFEGLYNLIWFTSTGYLDTTRTHRRSNGTMMEFEQLSDGKFLCSTQGNMYEGTPVTRIFKIDSTGVLDPTFNVPLDNWGWSYALTPLENGKLLAGGTYRLAGGTDTLCLLRLLPDGSIDPDFHLLDIENTITQSGLPNLWSVLPLNDGRIIITGRFDRVDGETRNCIALLDADGDLLDDAFVDAGCWPYTHSGYVWHDIHGIVAANDGSYYIHGAYWGYDDGTTEYPSQRFVSRLYGLNVGVREREPLHLEVYPNPTSSNVTINVDRIVPNGMMVLHDALGQEVLRKSVNGYANNMHLGGIPAGIYLLEICSAHERIAVERLVVE